MDKRIVILEFIIKSMKMFDDVEDILVYDKKNNKYHKVNNLYHMYNDDKEYMIIEI